MRLHVARTENLEPVDLVEVLDVEAPRGVVDLLPVILFQTNEPEEPREMKDRIGVVDVLTIARADVVNLRPWTGDVEVDSYFAERAELMAAVDRDVLTHVHPAVDVHVVRRSVAVHRRSTLEDLGDEALEVGHPIRLGIETITQEVRRDRVELVDDARAVRREVGEEVPACDWPGWRGSLPVSQCRR
jgi:hypothetical protein